MCTHTHTNVLKRRKVQKKGEENEALFISTILVELVSQAWWHTPLIADSGGRGK